MTAAKQVSDGKKRKLQVADEVSSTAQFSNQVHLEIPSDDEGDYQGEESDGVDDFPEIDVGSDEESEGDLNTNGAIDEDELEEKESGSGEDDEDDPESAEDSLSQHSDLHIFPKGKTIISNITNQEKRVYPEIEPEYDSDSSTEDVCNPLHVALFPPQIFLLPRRPRIE
jgi:ribosome biogenesis protein ERB1